MKEAKQRIVVKVGTSTLTHSSGSLDLRSMERLVRVLSDLSGGGWEVILVTSGAIAVGTAKMGLAERPKELRMKQAAAAVGQCRMMHIYDKLFSEYNCSVAQILLTGDDVEDPERAAHLQSTFSALLELGVIPVVNENDSVSSAFSTRTPIPIPTRNGSIRSPPSRRRSWKWQAAQAPGGVRAVWLPSSPPPGLPWTRAAIWSLPTASVPKTSTASVRDRISAHGSSPRQESASLDFKHKMQYQKKEARL